tara:strand:- start:3882 stop:4301 length:420 start_codon:yes stop_codon:yes gene_type:complete
MNESEPQQSALAEPKKKALIALFDVLSRSTRMTWPQIEKMVVAPFTTDYDVSVYALDNQLDNVDSIDGTPIQPSSQATIKSLWPVHYKPLSQSEMDADLARNYRDDQGYLPGLYARKVRRYQGSNHCTSALVYGIMNDQ